MEAKLDEQVVEEFWVDAESLRDLDAVFRRQVGSIDPNASVKYEVRRKDSLRYETSDVEEICQERNGRETGLREITLQAEGADDFSFKIEFKDGIDVSGQGRDRAKLLLLNSDVRLVIRDRMRGRIPWYRRFAFILSISVMVALAVAAFFYLTRDRTGDTDRARDDYLARVDEVDRQVGALLAARELETSEINASSSADEKLNFLVESEKLSLHNENLRRAAGEYPRPSFSSTSVFGPILAVVALLAFAVLAIPLLSLSSVTKSQSVFLIGDEVARQERKARRREKWFWGILVAAALGIAVNIVSAFIV